MTSTRPAVSPSPATVVLLHGIALGPWAMAPLARCLSRAGFRVLNLGYASCRSPLEELGGTWLPGCLRQAGLEEPGQRWHAVTHSMGGLLLRSCLASRRLPAGLSRVVMIAPPNHGTPLVDRIRHWWLFRRVYGPNGVRLGTDLTGFARQLGSWPEGPELGIIAGDRPLTGLFSGWAGRPGDGKVPLSSTWLEGAQDRVVLPHSHTGILFRKSTQESVLRFLNSGHFTTPSNSTSTLTGDARVPPNFAQSG